MADPVRPPRNTFHNGFYGRDSSGNMPFFGIDSPSNPQHGSGQRLEVKTDGGLNVLVDAANMPWSKAHTIRNDITDTHKYKPNKDPLAAEDGLRKMEAWGSKAEYYASLMLEKERQAAARAVNAANTPALKTDAEATLMALANQLAKGRRKRYHQAFNSAFVHRFREFLRGNGTKEEYTAAGMLSYTDPAKDKGKNKPISDHQSVQDYLTAWQNRVIEFEKKRTIMKMRMGRGGALGEAASVDDLWKYYKFVVHGIEDMGPDDLPPDYDAPDPPAPPPPAAPKVPAPFAVLPAFMKPAPPAPKQQSRPPSPMAVKSAPPPLPSAPAPPLPRAGPLPDYTNVNAGAKPYSPGADGPVDPDLQAPTVNVAAVEPEPVPPSTDDAAVKVARPVPSYTMPAYFPGGQPAWDEYMKTFPNADQVKQRLEAEKTNHETLEKEKTLSKPDMLKYVADQTALRRAKEDKEAAEKKAADLEKKIEKAAKAKEDRKAAKVAAAKAAADKQKRDEDAAARAKVEELDRQAAERAFQGTLTTDTVDDDGAESRFQKLTKAKAAAEQKAREVEAAAKLKHDQTVAEGQGIINDVYAVGQAHAAQAALQKQAAEKAAADHKKAVADFEAEKAAHNETAQSALSIIRHREAQLAEREKSLATTTAYAKRTAQELEFAKATNTKLFDDAKTQIDQLQSQAALGNEWNAAHKRQMQTYLSQVMSQNQALQHQNYETLGQYNEASAQRAQLAATLEQARQYAHYADMHKQMQQGQLQQTAAQLQAAQADLAESNERKKMAYRELKQKREENDRLLAVLDTREAELAGLSEEVQEQRERKVISQRQIAQQRAELARKQAELAAMEMDNMAADQMLNALLSGMNPPAAPAPAAAAPPPGPAPPPPSSSRTGSITNAPPSDDHPRRGRGNDPGGGTGGARATSQSTGSVKRTLDTDTSGDVRAQLRAEVQKWLNSGKAGKSPLAKPATTASPEFKQAVKELSAEFGTKKNKGVKNK